MGGKGSKGSKGGKGKKGKEKELKKLKRKEFKKTGLPNIDDFFSKIQEPMDSTCEISEAFHKSNEALIALCELPELVGKVEKTVKGVLLFMKEEGKKDKCDFYLTVDDDGKPTLETRKEPEGVLAKIFSAVKELVEAIRKVFEKTPELQKQITEAGEASKDLPSKAESDAKDAGLNPLDSAKAIKNTGENVKYLAGFPNEMIEFVNNVKEFVTIMKDIFSGDTQDVAKEGEKGEDKGEAKGESKGEAKGEAKGEEKDDD